MNPLRLDRARVAMLTIFMMGIWGMAPAHAETLAQAWAQALGAHPSLRAAQARSDAAASGIDVARAAGRPGLAAEAGYTVLDHALAMQADLLGQTLQLPVSQAHSVSVRVAATLPVYTGGRIAQGEAAATSTWEAAQAQAAVRCQSLKLAVAQAYVAVLRAERGVQLAEAQQARLAAHRQDALNLLDQGMAGRNELLAADVSLAEARHHTLQARHRLALAQAGYNQWLARPLDQPVALDPLPTPAVADEPAALAPLVARARAERSELVAISREMQALDHQAGAVRGEAAPQLAVSGGYGYQQNRYQVQPGQWFMGVGVRWQVADGGAVDHRAAALQRQRAALQAQREELAVQIDLQVREAWLGLQAAGQQMAVTGTAVQQAEENLRIVQDRYGQGLSTHTEVLEAQALRLGSEVRQADAVFEAVLAELRLQHASAGL